MQREHFRLKKVLLQEEKGMSYAFRTRKHAIDHRIKDLGYTPVAGNLFALLHQR